MRDHDDTIMKYNKYTESIFSQVIIWHLTLWETKICYSQNMLLWHISRQLFREAAVTGIILKSYPLVKEIYTCKRNLLSKQWTLGAFSEVPLPAP
jgi:hypothetical protein